MPVSQDILINFVINDEQLDSSLDRLQKAGQLDSKIADSFKQTQTAIKGTATDSKGLIQTFNTLKTTASTMGKGIKDAFNQGVVDALDKAGVSAEEFEQALKKAAAAPQSLRQELKLLTEQIAKAKVEGTAFGVEFEAMIKRAGELKDAIADANTDISNMGSDTRGIDNVIGSLNAVAGGFAVAQGAAALFGDENENVQKALLKVNAVMAVSQGIQQVSNALQKEGALIKLADSVNTGFQIAANKLYTLVTGKATAATMAFKAALLATGIGAVIALVISLVDAFSDLGSAAKNTTQDIENFNTALDNSRRDLDRFIDGTDKANAIIIEQAKQRGATEAEINKLTVKGLKENGEEAQKTLDKRLGALNSFASDVTDILKTNGVNVDLLGKEYAKFSGQATTAFSILAKIGDLKASGGFNKLSKDAQKAVEELENAANKANDISKQAQNFNQSATLKEEEFKTEQIKKGIEERKKAQEKAEADAKKRAEELRAAEQRRLNDELAAIERRLLKIKEGSQEEINIQKEVIAKKAEIDLFAEKLGENQKALIREKALRDQLELQKEFNKKLTQEQLQAQVDRNNAELQNIHLSEGERLRLSTENIHVLADLEIQNAKGNAAKILEIKAKLHADEQALFRASLEKINEDDIALTESRFFKAKTALQDLANSEKASAEDRISAIKKIEEEEQKSVDKRLGILELEKELKIISDEDYNLQYQNLLNKKYEITRDAEGKITAITLSEEEKRKENSIATIQQITEIASKAADLIDALNALATESEKQKIDASKAELKQLEEAGAITKKNAEIRNKEIEVQERQLRIKAAQREKQNAVFRAILAIPQAYLTGLTTPPPLGGPLLGAIYAGIAGAQAALIAARPIPKFAKGKKGNYEGLGMIGEAGSELFERNGKMYITSKPTITYIGAKDKIYSHSETKMMLPHMEFHRTDKIEQRKETMPQFDYNKLSKIMEKNQSNTQININKDFISESVKDGLMKTNYFNNRYSFK